MLKLPNFICELPSQASTMAMIPVRIPPAPAFGTTEYQDMTLRKLMLPFAIANAGVLPFHADAQSLWGASPIKEPSCSANTNLVERSCTPAELRQDKP